MKKLILILLLQVSCKGNGQNIEKNKIKKYSQISKVIENVLPEREKNSFSRIYDTYYAIEKDTVLLITEEHKKRNRKKSDTIIEVSIMKKKINISKKSSLILFQDNYIFLFKNTNRYILLDEIKDEYETFYDDLGEANKTYFPTKNIEHYKNNEYIVTYSNEGEFKIGLFEITENRIAKKFLSKGCLIYDEWSEFIFYRIKDEKIFVNYLKEWDGEEIGQIELKYENGEYSLDKDQCRE